jgi:hypothetical protein
VTPKRRDRDKRLDFWLQTVGATNTLIWGTPTTIPSCPSFGSTSGCTGGNTIYIGQGTAGIDTINIAASASQASGSAVNIGTVSASTVKVGASGSALTATIGQNAGDSISIGTTGASSTTIGSTTSTSNLFGGAINIGTSAASTVKVGASGSALTATNGQNTGDSISIGTTGASSVKLGSTTSSITIMGQKYIFPTANPAAATVLYTSAGGATATLTWTTISSLISSGLTGSCPTLGTTAGCTGASSINIGQGTAGIDTINIAASASQASGSAVNIGTVSASTLKIGATGAALTATIGQNAGDSISIGTTGASSTTIGSTTSTSSLFGGAINIGTSAATTLKVGATGAALTATIGQNTGDSISIGTTGASSVKLGSTTGTVSLNGATTLGKNLGFTFTDNQATPKTLTLSPPAAFTNSKTYTLPVDTPSTSGLGLVSDTTGTLSWNAPAIYILELDTATQTCATTGGCSFLTQSTSFTIPSYTTFRKCMITYSVLSALTTNSDNSGSVVSSTYKGGLCTGSCVAFLTNDPQSAQMSLTNPTGSNGARSMTWSLASGWSFAASVISGQSVKFATTATSTVTGGTFSISAVSHTLLSAILWCTT